MSLIYSIIQLVYFALKQTNIIIATGSNHCKIVIDKSCKDII